MSKEEQERSADNLARLRDRVATLVDRDFVWLGNTAQGSFRSHAEAYSLINELRALTGVTQRADLTNPTRAGGSKP